MLPQRIPSLPELPPIADTVPGYEITQSRGIVAPAATPQPVLRRIGEEVVRAMALADVNERVLKIGAVPAGDSPQAFKTFMARERQHLGDVIAESGIVLAD